LKNAKDVSALKAVSQNLMHSNLSIPDGVYGILSETDVQAQIRILGNKVDSVFIKDSGEISVLLNQLIKKLSQLNP
jgi:ABC-type uncharacterized transport system substrate-binding protein